jgi:hypothetical protein
MTAGLWVHRRNPAPERPAIEPVIWYQTPYPLPVAKPHVFLAARRLVQQLAAQELVFKHMRKRPVPQVVAQSCGQGASADVRSLG